MCKESVKRESEDDMLAGKRESVSRSGLEQVMRLYKHHCLPSMTPCAPR